MIKIEYINVFKKASNYVLENYISKHIMSPYILFYIYYGQKMVSFVGNIKSLTSIPTIPKVGLHL